MGRFPEVRSERVIGSKRIKELSLFRRSVNKGAMRLRMGFVLGLVVGAGLAADPVERGVKIATEPGQLRIEIDGELFANYRYEQVSRPFLYPVVGAAGIPVTRNWPMGFKEGEAKDHPHHRSLWYAHGSINGHDFWSESDRAGKTRHVEFRELAATSEYGRIVAFNELVANDGSVVATDIRSMTFRNVPGGARTLDFEITIIASHGRLTLGDTKEGSMAIRLAPTMRVEGPVAEGQIINSRGITGGATWGKRAEWVDYFGPVDGRMVGVAIFDHPSNPRHPTWWHVRKYGLFAANPFGVHNFEGKERGTGDYVVEEGKSVTWKYRFYFHEGGHDAADIATQYEAFKQAE